MKTPRYTMAITFSLHVAVALMVFAVPVWSCPASASAQTLSSGKVMAHATTRESGDETELPEAPMPQSEEVTVQGTPKRVALDLVHLVQFPRFIGRSDARWLIPLAGAAVASFSLDEKTMSEVVSPNPSFNGTSINVSDGIRDGFIAAPAALLAAGLATHNTHASETGLLSGEAMVDAYVVESLVKLASFRERPNTDRSEGSFYRTAAGYNSSFISGHSLTAWSSAAVLASEYPNRWLRVGVYTAATGVSVTRVMGQQHFPSDVLLGSAAGWLIGHYVYRAHGHKGIHRRALSTQ